jgi:hypothetical protein
MGVATPYVIRMWLASHMGGMVPACEVKTHRGMAWGWVGIMAKTRDRRRASVISRVQTEVSDELRVQPRRL